MSLLYINHWVIKRTMVGGFYFCYLLPPSPHLRADSPPDKGAETRSVRHRRGGFHIRSVPVVTTNLRRHRRGGRSEATRAVMNDSPVDCQNREWTEPQRERRPLRVLSNLGKNCRGGFHIRPFCGRGPSPAAKSIGILRLARSATTSSVFSPAAKSHLPLEGKATKVGAGM